MLTFLCTPMSMNLTVAKSQTRRFSSTWFSINYKSLKYLKVKLLPCSYRNGKSAECASSACISPTFSPKETDEETYYLSYDIRRFFVQLISRYKPAVIRYIRIFVTRIIVIALWLFWTWQCCNLCFWTLISCHAITFWILKS